MEAAKVRSNPSSKRGLKSALNFTLSLGGRQTANATPVPLKGSPLRGADQKNGSFSRACAISTDRSASAQAPIYLLRRDWQLEKPDPHGIGDGIGDGGGGWNVGHLAYGLPLKRHGPGRALENRRRELRNIPNARDFKIPHAERCDATVHHGIVLHQGVTQPSDHSAVDLALQRERVEHGPRVMRSRYSLHNDLPGFRIDLDLRHLSGEGGDRWLIFRL